MVNRVLSLALALILVLALAGCSGTGNASGTLPAGGTTSAADSKAAVTEAPAVDSTPAATEAPVLPAPQGADSVKTLLEKSLEFLHSGCDSSIIRDVQDPVAYLAMFLMEDFYEDEDLSFAQAREKAALLFGDAETLQAEDPRLAEMVLEEMDAEDPEEALNEYMSDLRDAFRSGEITPDDPNYEALSALLADWDKGPDYIFEHYPELMERAALEGRVFGLEGALAAMQRYARLEQHSNALERFQTLECEYRPENTNVEDEGWCSYDMGRIIDGNDVWMITMVYYVENETYYLMGYSIVLGSTGG